MSSGRRGVVVTGMGAVSPAGWGVGPTWDAVVTGRPCIRKIERFELFDSATRVGGAVPGFEDEMPEWSLSRHFCEAAIVEALGQAGLASGATVDDLGGVAGVDGVVVGNHGERGVPRPGSDGEILGCSDLAADLRRLIGAQWGFSLYAACASGGMALGTAMKLVERGQASVVVAGGSDCLLREYDFFHFCSLFAMTSRDCPPEEACCPFDARRDGFVLAEGAGFVVVEAEDHAARRGATPLARLEGYGANQNAYHFVASPPDAAGPGLAIAGALRDAGLRPEQVPYVNAHGTSTRDNDWCETLAVRNAFGEAADRVMMSSSKAALGHTMGAAGALEAIICVKVLEHQLAPPTINLREPDPNCDLDYVAGEARAAELDHVLSNSFGFGGHSSSLVLGRVA